MRQPQMRFFLGALLLAAAAASPAPGPYDYFEEASARSFGATSFCAPFTQLAAASAVQTLTDGAEQVGSMFYLPNSTCAWSVAAPAGQCVAATVLSIDLEHTFDTLTVLEAGVARAVFTGTSCAPTAATPPSPRRPPLPPFPTYPPFPGNAIVPPSFPALRKPFPPPYPSSPAPPPFAVAACTVVSAGATLDLVFRTDAHTQARGFAVGYAATPCAPAPAPARASSYSTAAAGVVGAVVCAALGAVAFFGVRYVRRRRELQRDRAFLLDL